MIFNENIKIATTQYALDEFANWQTYQDKIESFIKSAKEQQANIILFPEYAGLDLCKSNNSLLDQFNHLQNLLDQYIKLYQTLSKQYQIYIQPGSLPIKFSENLFHNRAYLFSPNGNYGYQNKIKLNKKNK